MHGFDSFLVAQSLPAIDLPTVFQNPVWQWSATIVLLLFLLKQAWIAAVKLVRRVFHDIKRGFFGIWDFADEVNARRGQPRPAPPAGTRPSPAAAGPVEYLKDRRSG